MTIAVYQWVCFDSNTPSPDCQKVATPSSDELELKLLLSRSFCWHPIANALDRRMTVPFRKKRWHKHSYRSGLCFLLSMCIRAVHAKVPLTAKKPGRRAKIRPELYLLLFFGNSICAHYLAHSLHMDEERQTQPRNGKYCTIIQIRTRIFWAVFH